MLEKTVKTLYIACQKGFLSHFHYKLVSIRYLLGVILQISDEHPRPFPPGWAWASMVKGQLALSPLGHLCHPKKQ